MTSVLEYWPVLNYQALKTLTTLCTWLFCELKYKTFTYTPVVQWLLSGADFVPQANVWQCLETFLVVTTAQEEGDGGGATGW